MDVNYDKRRYAIPQQKYIGLYDTLDWVFSSSKCVHVSQSRRLVSFSCYSVSLSLSLWKRMIFIGLYYYIAIVYT